MSWLSCKAAMESPITATVSCVSAYKNESFLIAAFQNGVISVHEAWEGLSGEECVPFLWNMLVYIQKHRRRPHNYNTRSASRWKN